MTLTLRNFCTFVITAGSVLAVCGGALGQTASSADMLNSVQEIKVAHVKSAPVKKAEPVKPVVKTAAPQPAPPTPVKAAPVKKTAAPKPKVKPVATKPQAVKATPAPKPKTVVNAVKPAAPPAPAKPAIAVREQAPPPAALPAPTAEPRVDRVVQFAQAKTEEPAKTPQASPIKTGLSVVLKLAIVLVLAYLSILALKLLYKRQESSPRIRRDLQVMDTVKLSQSSSLHVVDFNGKKLLVGSSAGQVNLLREFEQEEQVEAEAPAESRFADYLAKYSGSSFEKTPAGRVAGMLRDCADHLRNRRGLTGSGRTLENRNEA